MDIDVRSILKIRQIEPQRMAREKCPFVVILVCSVNIYLKYNNTDFVCR